MSFRRHYIALLPFAVALAAGACGKENPGGKSASVIAKAPDPWFVNAGAQCAFDSTTNHSDAEALVREFVQRDGQGAFFNSEPWFNNAVECPGRELAPAEYSIVADAQVIPLQTVADSARIGVRYTLLGTADANGFRPDLRSVTETLAVNRTRFGWRIMTPAPAPHVLVAVAKKRQAFTRADQWTIDATLTQARRFSPR